MKKLIFFEGYSCTGKSSLTRIIKPRLTKMGYKTDFLSRRNPVKYSALWDTKDVFIKNSTKVIRFLVRSNRLIFLLNYALQSKEEITIIHRAYLDLIVKNRIEDVPKMLQDYVYNEIKILLNQAIVKNVFLDCPYDITIDRIYSRAQKAEQQRKPNEYIKQNQSYKQFFDNKTKLLDEISYDYRIFDTSKLLDANIKIIASQIIEYIIE